MADIDKIKGKFSVYSNGEYVVLPGTKLYIFKIDGSLVVCRKDLRYAGRITFLSSNRLLLCDARTGFHMIDLCDGSDFWVAPYTKFELNAAQLAVSPDEAFAYTYDEWKGRSFISRLNLQTQEVDVHDLYMDRGATMGILCDEEGVPCMLKSLGETIGGKLYKQGGVRMHDYYYLAPGNTTTWKTKWAFQGNRSVFRFLDSTDRMVMCDFCVYEPSTETLTNLLENETSWQLPEKNAVDCWLDRTKSYLCVMYDTANVVIDLHARKVVAQYATDFTCGCLIGDEYWICADDRIHRKPFPALEAALPEKSVGTEWYFSKHPELW